MDLSFDGPPFRWNAERRRQLRVEFDVACFHLYDLERDEVAYVMDTFPIVRRRDEEIGRASCRERVYGRV